MYTTCKYAGHMSKMIQIRNVPDSVHRTVKSRAALEGLSLSDYLLRMVRHSAERPTIEELLERARRRGKVKLPVTSAQLIREERDSR